MKKITILLLALALILSVFGLTACNTTASTPDVVFVADAQGVTSGSNKDVWNAVQTFCKANDKTAAYVTAASDSEADKLAAVKQAQDDGAKYVVCCGYYFEQAVYNAQKTYPNLKIILVDGNPNDGVLDDVNTDEVETATYKTGANTVVVSFSAAQIGYVAGYAAVSEGADALGVLINKKTDETDAYLLGFNNGAKAAATAMNKTVPTVVSTTVGSNSANSTIVSQVNGWVRNTGVDVVFAVGGQMYKGALAAVSGTTAKVITVGVDQDIDNAILMSLFKSYDDAVTAALKKCDADFSTYAGKATVFGAAENCISVPNTSADWRCTTFTVSQLNTLLKNLANGTVVADAA